MPNASMATQTWLHRALQVDLRGVGGGGEHVFLQSQHGPAIQNIDDS